MPPTLRSLKLRGQIDTSSDSLGLTTSGTQPNECEVSRDNQTDSLKENLEVQNSGNLSNKKKPCKRIKYQKASFNLRAKLVQMVDIEGFSIRQAAKKLSLKYSTAKCIYKLFVDESRLGTTKISKETLLNAKIDEDDESQNDAEGSDTDTDQTKGRVKSTKRVKRDTQSTDEENTTIKKEFDEKSLEVQHKDAPSPSSNKLQRDNSIRTDITAVESPVVEHKSNANPENNSPIIVSYIPQMYQNTLVLIPVRIRGMNSENLSTNIDLKPLQAQNTTPFLGCQYIMFNPNGPNNNGGSNLLAGFNVGNNVSLTGVNLQ